MIGTIVSNLREVFLVSKGFYTCRNLTNETLAEKRKKQKPTNENLKQNHDNPGTSSKKP